MGYERELTTTSQPFLFDPLRGPIVGHVRSMFAGEIDVYAWTLWFGVPGRAPQRALAIALCFAWVLALGYCARRLRASIATNAAPLAESAVNPGSGR
jgi:hypothetical protein